MPKVSTTLGLLQRRHLYAPLTKICDSGSREGSMQQRPPPRRRVRSSFKRRVTQENVACGWDVHVCLKVAHCAWCMHCSTPAWRCGHVPTRTPLPTRFGNVGLVTLDKCAPWVKIGFRDKSLSHRRTSHAVQLFNCTLTCFDICPKKEITAE